MPPIVYVPTTSEEAQSERQVVMHRVADGRTALYTYSAPDRLDRYYLPGNPWVLCDVATLQHVHEQAPYDLLFVDVDPGLREDDEPGAGDGQDSERAS